MTAVLTTLIHFLRRSSIIGSGLLVVMVLGILSLNSSPVPPFLIAPKLFGLGNI